ncbi:MAG: diphosphate--fructose-6-phosphate 1-phosphotransferase [Chlamydiae bacterium]|nr:diphosphate--fructose-6-phosphate 1-phosphotransferase [Chlamydiota bacterium]
MSTLQKKRLSYQPAIPNSLKDLNAVQLQEQKEGRKPSEHLKKFFPKTFSQSPVLLSEGVVKQTRPLRIGALFSGGMASGGHNVLVGLFHALKKIQSQSQLFGILNGPKGLIENQAKELQEKEIGSYFNQGGFDCLGTGRTKIETEEQFASSLNTCKDLNLDGLVIIGGDDSNTNAAFLAEYFLQKGLKTQVVGVPKTIDGDLRSQDIEISFGFDSACKTYSEIIGNIARDAISAKKYYHFIKLMGRSASHIALECALATHPNLAFIGEEKKSLNAIVEEIATLICERFEKKKEYGVILIPEGLIEFIPEMKTLIALLNHSPPENLPLPEKKLFDELPKDIQKQILIDRDPHGNIQVSQIDTEALLIELVKKELKKRSFRGKFSAQGHFLGYEGRSCFPSNFDANYGYSLGMLAALCLRDGLTGVICAMQNLHLPPKKWELKAVPILHLMHLEIRNGKEKCVIEKTLVDLTSKPFVLFSGKRNRWRLEDDYQYPGPIQFFGDSEITDTVPITLL